jgi:uncharacterized protein YkwD
MGFLETIRHTFTPHTTNNQKARALHPGSMLFYILFFVLTQLSLKTIYNINPDILGYATDIRVEELLRLTNQKRIENGLSPLQLNERLSKAAYEKALDMFNKDYWAHNSPDGITPWRFVLNSGYTYLVAGENLAKNFSYSNEVVEAWMNSPSHRENLLKRDYKDIGFAVVDGKLQGEETTLVVQMFGKEKGARIASIQTQTIPTPKPTQAVEIYEVAGAKYNPLLDINTIQKQLSIFALLFLLSVLVIDGYLVFVHKKMRVAGKNWAHIIFLLTLLGIIYFVKHGAIL